ncbi:MAG: 3-deoxy-D-manno-octulosonic acid transferase [Candidatus Aminicenantes bacterium]|nr:3-deoxy-D-manno-octulosonic acid transferase [Candidatus Aminicenantes bacterium]
MYFLYSFVLLLSFIFYLPLYVFKLKIVRGESLFLKERLGFRLKPEGRAGKSVWIHAVSVGEVLSLQKLIMDLKKRHPEYEIYFSSLTNTGVRIAQEKLVGVDKIFFIPMDFRWIVKKYFRILKPELFILAESEFWPNLLKEAQRQTHGVLLINGRISPPSFKKYYRFRYLFKKILKNIDYFLVQTEREKKSLENIGVPTSCIEVSGNLKTEIILPPFTENEVVQLKESLNIFTDHKIVLAGSTRKGEEEKLIEAFTQVRKEKENIKFILAPRHPERSGEIEQLFKHLPFVVSLRSKIQSDQTWDVLILDTLGELSYLYALCDVAFIGGSLIPWGGQNLLEPAFYGKPVFFGPHMENFQELADKFIEADAAQIVETQEDLKRMFILSDDEDTLKKGVNARQILDQFQGVTERTLYRIDKFMNKDNTESHAN